jgi:hypothetical protein
MSKFAVVLAAAAGVFIGMRDLEAGELAANSSPAAHKTQVKPWISGRNLINLFFNAGHAGEVTAAQKNYITLTSLYLVEL